MAFLISVKAIAGAKKAQIIDQGIDSLGRKNFKIKVNKPAEDGKANQEIIRAFADYFKVKKSAVNIISGNLAKNKIIQIDE